MPWWLLLLMTLLAAPGWALADAGVASAQAAGLSEPATAVSGQAAVGSMPASAAPEQVAAVSAHPAARAPEADRMQFAWVREGGDCRDRCRAWIAASGRLTETSAADFETFVQGLDVRNATVALDSGGGLVDAGLALGRAFRRLGLTTTVGRTMRLPPDGSGEQRATLSPRATCASMCVFALIGGVRRHVPDEARVLVHQIWPSKLRDDALAVTYTAGNMVRIQREAGLIARYTVEMGADIELFELAMRIPPWESLRPLSRDELRRLRVHNADAPVAAGAATAAAAVTPAPAVEAAPPAVRSVAAAMPEPPHGWTITRQGERIALTRRHPLTVEGQEIGSFEVAFSCGEAPKAYQVAYRETRLTGGGAAAAAPATTSAAGANGTSDRLNGVRFTLQREAFMLRTEWSSSAAGEMTSSARGHVPPSFTAAMGEFGGASLLVETITTGRQRTAIRMGPAGLAEGFRELAVGCHK